MSRFYSILLLLGVLLSACESVSTDRISFNEDIRPILNAKCLRCHGGVKANGGFSLLFEEDAFGPTESGKPAIIRGNHRNSELYRRLVHTDPELRMPFEAAPLSEQEIDLIGRWIDQGAQWEKHWAYIPPAGEIQPPAVTASDWARNPIDQFVYAKLDEHDLTPAPEADKSTLLRRLYFDLTGLPPDLEDVQAFLQDDSPNAYEKVVDSLLASPHFGERWATMWLDLARYADTKGYEKDSNREIWKYRDWVIQAFNDDKPFDEFTIEQLAGDLLEQPTQEQLIATAFHRNSVSNDEGGTDDEEFRVASVIERVGTTFEVWQATTMACVQCHSHPYDPFRQKDFYRSMAIFNNCVDRDIYNEQPKLYTYPEAEAGEVQNIIEWIKNELNPEDQPPTSRFLYDQKERLQYHLGYRVTEAEDYAESSPLLELIWPELDMLWQVQDSSWIRFEDIDLTDVQQIGFRVATPLEYAGAISIHLDSLNGPELGRVKVTKTGEWNGWQGTKPTEERVFRELKVDIPPVEGKHQLFYRFWMGDTFIQHLFYVDKITYYEAAPRYAKYNRSLFDKLAQLDTFHATETPILQEFPPDKARKTYFFERGSWLMPGEEVQSALPAIYDQDHPGIDRLGFARWLVSRDNPLTARVIVNRFWEQIFGYGIVESMEEFGSQGSQPTHPELLDWLAVRFMDNDWRVKPLIRDLVLSATYRQAAIADSVKLEKDPRNQLLSRGSRTRLSAEQIRDQILAVSGLLDLTVGGPPLILPELEIRDAFIPDWVIRPKEGHYRRTLYTFWKRTDPFAGMITFDSPDRTVCTSRRIRTNTPLQALNLLNDETYFKASKALAEQMLQAGDSIEKQIRHGYRQVLGRDIDPAKLELLQQLYEESLAHYSQTASLKSLPASGSDKEESFQLAAMSMVANALLNLDEFIVKG